MDIEYFPTFLRRWKLMPSGYAMKTWLVEDDPRLRESLSSALRGARPDMSVSTFECGHDVLRAMETGIVPDVGLIDLGLPDMTGIDLIGSPVSARSR